MISLLPLVNDHIIELYPAAQHACKLTQHRYLFKEYRLVLSWVLKEVLLTEGAAIFSDQVVLLVGHSAINLLCVCSSIQTATWTCTYIRW